MVFEILYLVFGVSYLVFEILYLGFGMSYLVFELLYLGFGMSYLVFEILYLGFGVSYFVFGMMYLGCGVFGRWWIDLPRLVGHRPQGEEEHFGLHLRWNLFLGKAVLPIKRI